jgi:type IV secretion system protein VirB2
MRFNRGLGIWLIGGLAVGIALSCGAGDAMAQTAGSGAFQPVQTIAQQLMSFLTGSFATTAATIAVVSVGFMALTGRIPFMWAFSVIIGIALIFGGAQIVQTLQSASASG